MFTIKFTKNDDVNGEPVKKGEEFSVSRSIRDKKVNDGVAVEVDTNVATKISKPKKGK
jgi:hypothetical protein